MLYMMEFAHGTAQHKEYFDSLYFWFSCNNMRRPQYRTRELSNQNYRRSKLSQQNFSRNTPVDKLRTKNNFRDTSFE